MPQIFDPLHQLRLWHDHMLRFRLDYDYDDVKAIGRLSHACPMATYSIVQAWLLGLHEEIRPALERTLYWLRWAEEHQEPAEPAQIAYRNCALGIALWLVEGRDDPLSYQRAMAAWEQILDDRRQHHPMNVDYFISLALMAGNYLAAIRRYEALAERTDIDIKTAKSPRAIGYVLCRHLAYGEGDLEAIKQAVAGLLRRHVQSDWLAHGNARDPAIWLKILYWHLSPNPPAPELVIYKAYDHMPKVSRPPWVPVALN